MAARNLGQMRTTLLRLCGSSPQIANPGDYNSALTDRHRQVAAGYMWSARRREQILQTVATVTAGTVAVTQGSPTVVGTGTAFAGSMVGQQITIPGESTFFYINSVADATDLTLGDADGNAQNWVQASASGLKYTIFQSIFTMPANVAHFLQPTRDWPLDEVSSEYIERVDPRRTSLSGGTPQKIAYVRTGVVSGALRRYVELWPVPSVALTLRLPYLIEPQELVKDADLPNCPSELVEWWAFMDLSYAVHSKTGDARWVRNAEAARRTLYGDQTTGDVGLIRETIAYDIAQYGIPRRLSEGGFEVGDDIYSTRDWSVILG